MAGGGCPGHCRMLSGIPGLHPLEAPLPDHDNEKCLQTVPNVPRGEEMGNSLPVENPCFITMQFLLGMGGGLCCVASRILIFRPGIEPAFPPLKE